MFKLFGSAPKNKPPLTSDGERPRWRLRTWGDVNSYFGVQPFPGRDLTASAAVVLLPFHRMGFSYSWKKRPRILDNTCRSREQSFPAENRRPDATWNTCPVVILRSGLGAESQALERKWDLIWSSSWLSNMEKKNNQKKRRRTPQSQITNNIVYTSRLIQPGSYFLTAHCQGNTRHLPGRQSRSHEKCRCLYIFQNLSSCCSSWNYIHTICAKLEEKKGKIWLILGRWIQSCVLNENTYQYRFNVGMNIYPYF